MRLKNVASSGNVGGCLTQPGSASSSAMLTAMSRAVSVHVAGPLKDPAGCEEFVAHSLTRVVPCCILHLYYPSSGDYPFPHEFTSSLTLPGSGKCYYFGSSYGCDRARAEHHSQSSMWRSAVKVAHVRAPQPLIRRSLIKPFSLARPIEGLPLYSRTTSHQVVIDTSWTAKTPTMVSSPFGGLILYP